MVQQKKVYTRVDPAHPGHFQEERFLLPPFVLEHPEQGQWCDISGRIVQPPTFDQSEEIYSDVTRLDILTVDAQLRWALHYLNGGESTVEDGLSRARPLALQLGRYVARKDGEWKDFPLPDIQPNDVVSRGEVIGEVRTVRDGKAFVRWNKQGRLSTQWELLEDLTRVRRPAPSSNLDSEIQELQIKAQDLERRIEDIKEYRDGGSVVEDVKGNKIYYRYQFLQGGRRKTYSIRPQEVGKYREEIANGYQRRKLQRKLTKVRDAIDEMRASASGRYNGHYVATGDLGVWKVADPRAKGSLAAKPSFTIYYEMKGSRPGRTKRSKIHPQLRFQVDGTNDASLSRGLSMAKRIAQILNEESPGRMPDLNRRLALRRQVEREFPET